MILTFTTVAAAFAVSLSVTLWVVGCFPTPSAEMAVWGGFMLLSGAAGTFAAFEGLE